MKLEKIYSTAVNLGMSKDPRGKEGIEKYLAGNKREYDRLKGDEKKYFDTEKLTNPFGDTRILNGDPGTEVKSLIAGIDVETPELILVDRLRETGRKIDLCVGHHPEGRALASLPDVMDLQADVWADFGVPVNIGDSLIKKRMGEVEKGLMALNHQRPIDAARLLGIPFICIHTPADNMVTDHLTRRFKKKKPHLVGDVIEALLQEEEYRKAAQVGDGPTVLLGEKKNRAGEVMVDMTGGTGGPPEMIEKLSQAGVGTIVGMHMGEKTRKEAEKHHINVVIAGHMASDSIGLNLVLDQLEKQGVKCQAFSGFIRVSRLKK
ncbi:MAG: NGG1p interacting factor NIF3 [Actinobacteria bacterium]|nr:NGG1p interacting factor NIF3 [Actinomycetota bacterium]